jgi:hypothetical protein
MSKPTQPQFAQAPDGSWHPIPMAPPPKKKGMSPLGAFIVVLLLGGCGLFGLAAILSPSKNDVTTSGTSIVGTTFKPLTPEEIDAAVTAEIKQSCDEAVRTRETPTVHYSDAWVGKKFDDIKLAVIVCTQQARDAEAAEAVANAKAPDVDAVIKDPDTYKGQTFVVIAKVMQLDGATGPCLFRGVWDNTVHQYSIEYKGDNGVFVNGDGKRDCPTANDVDKDDVVRVWIKVLGKNSYDTQIGGNTTAPQFQVVKSEVLQKL